MTRPALLLVLALAAGSACAALPAPGRAGAPKDARYCGEPRRDGHGEIIRSKAALRHFTAAFPCPSTLLPTIACPGWAVDHVIPLAVGGCDVAINMQWLPDGLKSCGGQLCKDRWERRYHALPRSIIVVAPP